MHTKKNGKKGAIVSRDRMDESSIIGGLVIDAIASIRAKIISQL
jgi:hypothetical protein